MRCWTILVLMASGVVSLGGWAGWSWAQSESVPAATKPAESGDAESGDAKSGEAQSADAKSGDAAAAGVGQSVGQAKAPAKAAAGAGTKPSTPPSGEGDAPNLVSLDGLTRLSKEREVWIDAERQRVIVGGKVCLNRGMLEMFACPRGTKEHESIVSLNAKAYEIHAALLAIGAKPGRPVRYQPEYQAAEGEIIKVQVQWRDADGKPHSVPAQQWIRQVKSGQPMAQDWVFAGSGFWKDTATGKEHYLAEGGEVICVSNFGTALLDLPIQSSQDNADLMFEAFTDHIPPLDTPVRIILSRVAAPAKR